MFSQDIRLCLGFFEQKLSILHFLKRNTIGKKRPVLHLPTERRPTYTLFFHYYEQ